MAKRNENELRFQVIVRPDSHPLLFDMLKDVGQYKMSKKLLAIASSGAVLRHGGTALLPVPVLAPPQPQGKPVGQKAGKSTEPPKEGKPRYTIPPGADDVLGDVFASMGMSISK